MEWSECVRAEEGAMYKVCTYKQVISAQGCVGDFLKAVVDEEGDKKWKVFYVCWNVGKPYCYSRDDWPVHLDLVCPHLSQPQSRNIWQHSIATLKGLFVVNLQKGLENRVTENVFLFANYVQFPPLQEEKPIRPCHYNPCAIRSSKRPALCPISNFFFGAHARYAEGYCTSAHAPDWSKMKSPSPNVKKKQKTPGRQIVDDNISKALQGMGLIYKAKAANAATTTLALQNLAEDPPV